VGRPSILVPFPHAADDHQRKNAEALEAQGAAVCIAEGALDEERLLAALMPMVTDASVRRVMADAARGLGRPDAAAAIVDDLCDWLGCAGAVDEDAPEDGARSDGEGSGEATGSRAGAAAALRGDRPYVPWGPFPQARMRVWVAEHSAAGRRRLIADPALLE
jgi:hypothetical protein